MAKSKSKKSSRASKAPNGNFLLRKFNSKKWRLAAVVVSVGVVGVATALSTKAASPTAETFIARNTYSREAIRGAVFNVKTRSPAGVLQDVGDRTTDVTLDSGQSFYYLTFKAAPKGFTFKQWVFPDGRTSQSNPIWIPTYKYNQKTVYIELTPDPPKSEAVDARDSSSKATVRGVKFNVTTISKNDSPIDVGDRTTKASINSGEESYGLTFKSAPHGYKFKRWVFPDGKTASSTYTRFPTTSFNGKTVYIELEKTNTAEFVDSRDERGRTVRGAVFTIITEASNGSRANVGDRQTKVSIDTAHPKYLLSFRTPPAGYKFKRWVKPDGTTQNGEVLEIPSDAFNGKAIYIELEKIKITNTAEFVKSRTDKGKRVAGTLFSVTTESDKGDQQNEGNRVTETSIDTAHKYYLLKYKAATAGYKFKRWVYPDGRKDTNEQTKFSASKYNGKTVYIELEKLSATDSASESVSTQSSHENAANTPTEDQVENTTDVEVSQDDSQTVIEDATPSRPFWSRWWQAITNLL